MYYSVEPDGRVEAKGKTVEYIWSSGRFDIKASGGVVDLSYDFEGLVGNLDLGGYQGYLDPHTARGLAYVLLSAADKAEEV